MYIRVRNNSFISKYLNVSLQKIFYIKNTLGSLIYVGYILQNKITR